MHCSAVVWGASVMPPSFSWIPVALGGDVRHASSSLKACFAASQVEGSQIPHRYHCRLGSSCWLTMRTVRALRCACPRRSYSALGTLCLRSRRRCCYWYSQPRPRVRALAAGASWKSWTSNGKAENGEPLKIRRP
ncbi:hypothetical protein PF010_g2251 [Phytophthora fragariae]|uniref:Uncharacterized protein n=2 Tax=Phytophthora TaxID=4783 RepID=A0A6A3LNC5_9STRA|nr:hypothetical protein PR002_g24775 [Phytophthora rubi]KAE9019628.1 hypothetical protein PF011_g5751 [Phytophthora fragariae]KAE9049129.1 hypothetical protein PR001_g3561 [Phytophthora rubi]KAE9135018.1 hypothetical protein PF010_g2251 [Phytophthora fragariae]KAE9251493.1 hypothetical protein PF004_g2436 [Phytophthora fragariae]